MRAKAEIVTDLTGILKIEKSIIDGEEVNSIDARRLHKSLELKSDFSTWIKKNLELFNEGTDYITLTKKVERQILKEYIVTMDIAKHIAMLQRNEVGMKIRRYFISTEKQLRENTQLNSIERYELEQFRKSKEVSGHFMEDAKNGHAKIRKIKSYWKSNKNSPIDQEVEFIKYLDNQKAKALTKLNGLFDSEMLKAIKAIESKRAETLIQFEKVA